MSSKSKGNYARKHSPDRKVDKKLAEAVKSKVKDTSITCAAAFRIVREQESSPSEVGFTIDSMEVKIMKCQIGIFGYGHEKKPVEPMEMVSDELQKAIKESLKEGKLPCASAWEIAEKMDMAKMEVTAACEKLKIKISPCQLGAF